MNGPVPVELSTAATVKLNVPLAVGVPDRVPLAASAMPAGKAPAVTEKLYVPLPPEAVSVSL